MTWLQLHINTSPEAAKKVDSALQKNGALSVTLADNADQPIFEPALGETPLWQETRVTGLFNADVDSKSLQERILRECKQAFSSSHWSILEDKDWEREWMIHYHPIQCTENFWICPSWTPVPDPKAVNLMLDPGLAFGTGTHPTTFLCLQWIAEQNFSGKKAIDYGCGSGILGIAALLLGAEQVTGVDIDPQALLATRDNVNRNQLQPDSFPVCFPDKLGEDKTNFVLANILAGPLVELAPTLSSHLSPGGKICLSGILNTQRDAIIEAYSGAFNIDSVTEKESWICVAGTKC